MNKGLTPALLSILLGPCLEELVDGQKVENCCWEGQAPVKQAHGTGLALMPRDFLL